jgi:hypothetical protein
MTRIEVVKKPRKDSGSALWQTKDGTRVFIGRNYALQNEIDENKQKTRERSCYKGCQTCGFCVNSRRNCAHPYNFDNGKKVFCEGCEKFGFHDCNNGFLRNAHGEAEPFTEEAQKLFDQGGKPLI